MKMIKKCMIAATGFSMLMAGTAQAHSGWYVGVNVGQTGLTDIDTTSSEAIGGSTRSIDIETDSDTSFGFKVGYNVVGHESKGQDRFNVELYYQNSDHDADSLVFDNDVFLEPAVFEGEALAGSLEVETILLRASYEIELGAIDPYFGIGIGQADLEVDAIYGGSIGAADGTPPFASGSDSATAVEFRVGAQYSISKRFSLFLEYSYLAVDDVTFDRLGGGPGGLAVTEQTDDFSVDSVNFGVNFKF